MSGMRTRLETKPGASLTATGVLPRRWASSMAAAKVASEVCSARITSTRAITGTGFMKCMPTKRPGRRVSAARVVMAMDEALLDVAKDDFVAGARENMSDAVAHGAGAKHGDGFDGIGSGHGAILHDSRDATQIEPLAFAAKRSACVSLRGPEVLTYSRVE